MIDDTSGRLGTAVDPTRPARRTTVAAIGEVLWDVFPDGACFGGAPANVMTHTKSLAGASIDAILISQIGEDELGREARETLRSRDIETTYLTTGAEPTGRVDVTLDGQGQPTYQIQTPAAWDTIPWTEALAELAQRADAVCFGTLAQRADGSRATIRRFLDATPPSCLRVLDLNLRDPFWDRATIVESLRRATILKLNEEELRIVGAELSYGRDDFEILERLLAETTCQMIAVTRGEAGAFLVGRDSARIDGPSLPTHVVDTVGAGDAFTACLIVGWLEGMPWSSILDSALAVASFVCSQPGATPVLPSSLAARR